MALDWAGLDVIGNNLVAYLFGSEIALSIGVIVFFFLLLLGGGVELKISAILVLPLVAAYAAGGAFGVNVWILHLAIIIGGIIYSTAIIKVMS